MSEVFITVVFAWPINVTRLKKRQNKKCTRICNSKESQDECEIIAPNISVFYMLSDIGVVFTILKEKVNRLNHCTDLQLHLHTVLE